MNNNIGNNPINNKPITINNMNNVNNNMFNNITNNQMINSFKKSYINTSIFKVLDKHKLNIAINYMHNTTLSLYKAWVNDNKSIPFDEIVELNYNLVINGLSGLTKNTK